MSQVYFVFVFVFVFAGAGADAPPPVLARVCSDGGGRAELRAARQRAEEAAAAARAAGAAAETAAADAAARLAAAQEEAAAAAGARKRAEDQATAAEAAAVAARQHAESREGASRRFLEACADENICVICSDLIVLAHVMPACSHAFCYTCIAEWIEKLRALGQPVTCPTCREVVRERRPA